MPASTLRFQGRDGMVQFRCRVAEALWNDTVDTKSTDAPSLHVTLSLLPIGTTVLAHSFHSACGLFHLERSRDRLARNNPLAFAVVIVRNGTSELVVGGRSVQVRAGDMYFMDATATAFRKVVSHGYHEHLILVRSEANLQQRHVRGLELVPRRGAAALLAEHVQSLFVHGVDVEPLALGSLSAVLLSLIDASLPAQGRHPGRDSAVVEARRGKIERFMKAQLGDPTLTPARIAAAHRVSVRYLYKLFEGSERSLCGTLLELRLQSSKLALENGRSGLSVQQVAYAHGFVSHSHFCHSFKTRFGVSPSETRAVATGARPR